MAWTDAKLEFVDSDLRRQLQFPSEFLVRVAIGGVPISDLRKCSAQIGSTSNR
jgi:hypothetical protein